MALSLPSGFALRNLLEREANRESGAAVGAAPAETEPPCDFGDGPHDGEPEAAAAAAGRVRRAVSADEAVEDLVLHVGGNARPVVEHLEQRLVAVASGRQLDGGLLGGVPHGVLEQIADQPVELVGVALEREGPVEMTLDPAAARQRLDLLQGAGGDRRQVKVLGRGPAPGVGAGEEQ